MNKCLQNAFKLNKFSIHLEYFSFSSLASSVAGHSHPYRCPRDCRVNHRNSIGPSRKMETTVHPVFERCQVSLQEVIDEPNVDLKRSRAVRVRYFSLGYSYLSAIPLFVFLIPCISLKRCVPQVLCQKRLLGLQSLKKYFCPLWEYASHIKN